MFNQCIINFQLISNLFWALFFNVASLDRTQLKVIWWHGPWWSLRLDIKVKDYFGILLESLLKRILAKNWGSDRSKRYSACIQGCFNLGSHTNFQPQRQQELHNLRGHYAEHCLFRSSESEAWEYSVQGFLNIRHRHQCRFIYIL